jgi:phosphate-selective porin OprO/OprP
MVHMAVGGEQRHFNTELNPNMNGDNIRLRTRGDLRNTTSQLVPNYTDTGNFYASGQGVLDAELAVQWGPLLVQGEWCFCWMEGAATQQYGRALPNAYFNGGYLEALYFLTGENRPYLREAGVFGRTIPNQSSYLVRGAGFNKGAWQVGARYDFMDLNSPGINGGQLQDMTLGLNWWFNPNARSRRARARRQRRAGRLEVHGRRLHQHLGHASGFQLLTAATLQQIAFMPIERLAGA